MWRCFVCVCVYAANMQHSTSRRCSCHRAIYLRQQRFGDAVAMAVATEIATEPAAHWPTTPVDSKQWINRMCMCARVCLCVWVVGCGACGIVLRIGCSGDGSETIIACILPSPTFSLSHKSGVAARRRVCVCACIQMGFSATFWMAILHFHFLLRFFFFLFLIVIFYFVIWRVLHVNTVIYMYARMASIWHKRYNKLRWLPDFWVKLLICWLIGYFPQMVVVVVFVPVVVAQLGLVRRGSVRFGSVRLNDDRAWVSVWLASVWAVDLTQISRRENKNAQIAAFDSVW